ncbi:MAG: hypothetical protein ACO1Q7_18740 [Gemmatimonas sp.]
MLSLTHRGVLLFSSLLLTACSRAGDSSATSDSGGSSQATASGALREVDVIGLDYAFSMPDTLDPGRTAFRFRNDGKVYHEYNVVLLKEGATLQQFIEAENKGEPVTAIMEAPVGVLFAEIGQSSPSLMSVDLIPGRTYAVHCIFRDSAKAPTHRELGMFKSITVRGSAAPTATAIAFDTIVGTDYAFTKYPRAVTPGWHHFVFRNDGKQRHEVSISMLKKGVTLPDIMKVAANQDSVFRLLDGDMGVLHSPGGTSPLGSLDFEILPDREYVLFCAFQDDAKAPPHFMLGMVTTMLATKQ